MTSNDATYARESEIDNTLMHQNVLSNIGSFSRKKGQSRFEIMSDLAKMGVNTEELSHLSIESLGNLLNGLHSLLDAHKESKGPGRPKMNPNAIPALTNNDKAMLRYLSESKGRVSSLKISRELDIPLSTIQRRRKRLEDVAIETNYSIKAEKLGWRSATLYISSTSGRTEMIGKELLDLSDQVSSVTRTVGDNSFDLRADLIFRTIEDLTSLIDKIKSMPGVSNVIWSESLKLIGKNDISKKIIDSLG